MDDFIIKIKAIADETRLEIIKNLLVKNYCVKALAKDLNISESAVSQHLKILREADLVLGEKKGYFVHYMVKREKLREIAGAIEELAVKETSGCSKCNKKE
ncbi:ArsR/SmtB family transcription factor [Natronospora cellulosivora (SeqCode)]